ncbi:MAG: DUF952 domain-containing protein [Chloroflexota bacterium]
MTMIYHLTTEIEWKLASESGTYSAPSLSSEGFIHCSTKDQILRVANAFYQSVDDLVLMCIDEDAVEALVKWEAPAHPDGQPAPFDASAEKFPHIYGTINMDAVTACLEMPKGDDGYRLPDGI